jgi:hypothetical protein
MDTLSGAGREICGEKGPQLPKVRLHSTVKFFDEDIKSAYFRLGNSEIFNQLTAAFETIGKNAFSGIQIPKRLIPREYLKRGVPNLWKRNLANGWRLLYFIVEINSEVYSVILEWLDHKNYERKFGY